jgi:serine protease AprX
LRLMSIKKQKGGKMENKSKRLLIGTILVAFLLGLTGVNSIADNQLADSILEGVASDMGVNNYNPEDCSVEGKTFPLTGITLYQVRVFDSETGKFYRTVVDQDGFTKDLEAVRLAEREAHDALYGRLEPTLYDSLELMTENETTLVSIWLKSNSIAPLERPDEFVRQSAAVEAGDAVLPLLDLNVAKSQAPLEEGAGIDAGEVLAARVEQIRSQQADQREAIEAHRQAVTDDLSDQVAALQEPLLAEIGAMGFAPIYVSPIAPLVYFELPKWAIQDLAQHADIDTIYGPNDNRDFMNIAKPTQKADIVDSWFGFDGLGIDVAICEDSRIQFNNPYLIAGTTRVPGDPNVDRHATATAGMVASQHGTYQGIAQGVNLFSANGTDYAAANMSAAMDWAAITQNVDVLNNSWGGNAGSGNLNDHDRHLDYLVRHYLCTVTVAAGNDGPGGFVGSPAKGYNVISVGNFRDQGTLTWDDDAMMTDSSYVDPSTGVEKPEVAAAGTFITSTTDVTPWIGDVGWGTSYAAPMVAGEAALLMDRSSTLQTWPEVNKAIIMATALHNIEGSSRLSEIDGAGGVDMRAAFRVADEGWWNGRSVSSTTTFPFNLTTSLYAYAGETVRAVITWDSNPNASYTTDPLEADLILRAYRPSGTAVAASDYVYNNFEIVEFVAPETGYYRLEVDKWSFTTGASTYLGSAWWPGHRVLTANTTQSLGTPPISNDYYRFTRGSFWNAVGIRKPTSTGNYWLYLYEDSAFGDPDDYNWLEDSRLGQTTPVEYVVIDGNHAPVGDYYAEVETVSGTGTYPITWSSSAADTGDADGTFGPYIMSTSQVVRVFDCYLTNGVNKYFGLKVTSGNADLGMGLHHSDAGTSLYEGRSQAVATADSAGAGGSEFMSYQTTTTDWGGLVVFNNGATSTSTFYLYTDTTAPTGSIVINGGAAVTSSTSVTLTLSATDSQTGVAEMRFGNLGGGWSAWEPYGTSKSWTLIAGDGSKSVWVQFKNNAGQISSQYGDGIILDTAPPTPSPMTWATAPYETSTSSISMVATTASDPNGPVEYYFFSYTGNHSGWQSSPSYTDSGLAANTRYDYFVRARDAAGNTTLWSAVSYDYTDIETPSGVTFGSYGSTYINARSTNTPSNLASDSSGLIIYNVTAGTNSGWKQNNDYWYSGGLTPNTSYAFRARARNGDASLTPYSNYYYRRTLANVPGAAAFSEVTQTSIRANWTANGNPAGTMYYCENITAGTNSGWTTSTSWNSTGLDPGTSYSFRVRARNNEGFGTAWTSLGSESTLSGTTAYELAVDFGSSGLYHYDNGTWAFLTGSNSEYMVALARDLYVDFGASGLYKYDGTWIFLTGSNSEDMVAMGTDLYVDFGTSGLYKYDGTWTWLTGSNSEDMVAVGTDLYVDFGTAGLFKYDGTWTWLTGSNSEDMVAVGTDLYVDFGASGLYKYDGTWTFITGANAEDMVAVGTDLYVDFGASGLYKYDGTWTFLTGNTEDMVAVGTDLYVDFGTSGLYKYDGAWTFLTGANAEDMVAVGTDLYVDFGTSGLYKYDGTWSFLTGANAEDMIAVDLND